MVVTMVALLGLLLLVEAVASSMSLSALGREEKGLAGSLYTASRQGLVTGAYYTYVNSSGAPLVAVVLVNPNPDWVDVALVGVVAGRAVSILDNGTVIGVGGSGSLVRVDWGPGFNGTGVRIPPHSVAYVYAMLPGLPADLSACTNPGGCTKLTKTGPGEFIEVSTTWHPQFKSLNATFGGFEWRLEEYRKWRIDLKVTGDYSGNASLSGSCYICCHNGCGILDSLRRMPSIEVRLLKAYQYQLLRCPSVLTGNDLSGALEWDKSNHLFFYLSVYDKGNPDPVFRYDTLPSRPAWANPYGRYGSNANVVPQEWLTGYTQQCGVTRLVVDYFVYLTDNNGVEKQAWQLAKELGVSGIDVYVQGRGYKGRIDIGPLQGGAEAETNLTIVMIAYEYDKPLTVIYNETATGNDYIAKTIRVPDNTTRIRVISVISTFGPGAETCAHQPFPILPPSWYMTGGQLAEWLSTMWQYCGLDLKPAYYAAYQIDVGYTR